MSRFAYISDLPPQVRDAFSVPRQEQWLAAYQQVLQENPDEAAAYMQAWKVVLSDVFSGEVEPDRIPEVLDTEPVGVSTDGKTVSITINADEMRLAAPAALERCVMDLMDRKDMVAKYPDPKTRKSHAFAICRASTGLSEHYSYLRELSGLEFVEADGKTQSWIQAMPLGSWTHPVYGPIDITPERVARFAENVTNNVRGQQLDIDYAHKDDPSKGEKAAGWVIGAEARADGLWLLVEWTPNAVVEIRNGEWKYFSPEFLQEWLDPRGAVFADVLLGGALTNRPFLKGIMPINLSDAIAKHDTVPVTRTDIVILTPADVAAAVVGLTEPDERIISIAKQKGPLFVEQLPDAWKQTIDGTEEVNGVEELVKKLAEMLGVGVVAEEIETSVRTLKEFYDARASEEERAQKFAELYPEEAQQLAELRVKDRRTEAALKFKDWANHPESHKGVPAKLHDPVRDFRAALPTELVEGFDGIMDEIAKTGTVDFVETPLGDPATDGAGGSASDKVIQAAEKIIADGKAKTFREALPVIKAENPDLYDSYIKGVK